MNNIEIDKKEQVIESLKQEINQIEPLENYSQWLMGVSLKKNATQVNEEVSYTARMVTKTNQSSLVDGMDIEFTEKDGKMLIDFLYFENNPDLMGSSVQDSIAWMMKLNKEIIYLEQINPYQEQLYLGRLKYIIGEYSFKKLEDYNLHKDHVRSIENIYTDLLQETLLSKVIVEGEEVRPGEYVLKIVVENTEYNLSPKLSFSREEVIAEIRKEVILKKLGAKADDESDNYEKYREIVNDTSSR